MRFVIGAYAQHTPEGKCGGSPQSLIEFGCGPARHAVEACLQGIERVTALDANPRMLEYAGKLAAAAGAKVQFIEGRLEEVFSSEANLPEEFMPADLALLPLNTVAHALTNDDALRWLAAAGNALRPEGLLVMELPPLDDVFNGNLLQGDEWELEGEEEGENDLKIVFGTKLDRFDFCSQELQPLARLAGFGVEGVYGDMEQPPHPDADLRTNKEAQCISYRFIVVLKKQQES
ncbi:hypothetical protein COCSUDRAFT_83545 [Coccomyxa subellipsoidea C-169]|uniref:Methyltransferase domain-containing protein n=1 Tax=Coccomyxa subellipsoidea (strain C-169) TaxID=574566 RepID=I0YPM6_COCSC|nr:hypothetical protein COCSUDRAFT_83545 [Coccomyxa subellipsoidea C-169]EIE20345.1 hypothetical protein COCSUDRAFT_83545 [Coccomyxa subellipsoidea C-169]|eukprot:XP_005644889.1 hypothetical protein COCSUDRAFT_83545 [Coccomyxa subellipsoidea C-169]